MWLILIVCFLSQVISITAVNEAVSWHVSTEKVEFGNDVTLKCKVNNRTILQKLDHPAWEVKGPKQVKCQWGRCSDAKKYSMTIHPHVSYFALIIHNFSETDLNVDYSCSYGYTKKTNNLTEDRISILKMPAKNSIIDNIAVENGKINITIIVPEVYPVPLCSVNITKLNKQVISEVTLNNVVFDISKYQKKVVVFGLIDVGQAQCERHIKVDCCLKNTLENLINRTITVCQELQENESPAQFNVIATVLLTVVALLLLIGLIALVIRLHRFFHRGDTIITVSRNSNGKTVSTHTFSGRCDTSPIHNSRYAQRFKKKLQYVFTPKR
ncbi:Hypothetical predicted protein [Mytilus galloprovincialis]|uniref:Ig-like domain-containing protein n=1 Tax=Mytilus galloprovincialis TaxID=29158 RepID=A0A8B6DJE0_MYTGA|nr:Hypothetical predicted protein [Mytilus galloprovincialis]